MKSASAALGVVICTLLPCLPASQPQVKSIEQWPHWRGPLATGEAPQADPPVTWSEKSNVRWKAALPGRGSSTPVVWGDSVFVAAAVDTKRAAKPEDIVRAPKELERKTEVPGTYHQFILFCFDRQTGAVRWQKIAAERVPHEGHHATHSYAAGSPTTDGKHVWVSFGSQGVYCYDFAGNLTWKRELGLMWTRFGFGEAVTPVLHGDALVLNYDQELKSRLIVLDARTGETKWEVERDDVTSWNTPCVVDHAGKGQIIVNGTKKARGYDLATGQLLWECGGNSINAIPSPLAADGVVYCMSGFLKYQAVAIPLGARGELTDSAKLIWKHTKGTPYCPSPLLVGGKLYFTQGNEVLLTCLDAKTGKTEIDRERLPLVTSFYGSPVAARGRIYLVDRDGTALVLKQGNTVEVLATNRLDDHFDASPVAVGRQLLLRGHENLYCLEAR
jgi:outer membrane protein assembly factor BamB